MSVVIPIEQQTPRPASRTSTSDDHDGSPSRNPPPQPLRLWVLCAAVLPFLTVPLAHVLSSPETATGLFHYELPYYVANGRAAFERGNGLFYPNPFDPAADAPAIYVHWLPQMIGIATAVLGGDPGTLMLWLTVFGALAMAAATCRLVAVCLPRDLAGSRLAPLVVMWGGGLLAAGGAVTGALNGNPDLLQLDPGHGMWFLNWGRNVLFPTEAVYHAITACCWVAEIRRRHVAATLLVLLLATTHPWSGLELLLTVNLWRALEALRTRRRTRVIQLAASASILTGFLIYYRVWLPGFEQHARLQRVWELDWSLSWTSAALAWGVVAWAAVRRLRQAPDSLRAPAVQFLLCAFAVAIGLSLHDRLMKPVQPLHFTRGYVWMPLCLLGLPVLLEGIRHCWRHSLRSRVLVCGLALIFVSDNLVFGVVHSWRQFQQQDGFHLDIHDRVLLADLHERFPPSVVLTESDELNYLLPAYASQRPWLGHRFNTPDYPERRDVMRQCFARFSVAPGRVPAEVGLLVVSHHRDSQALAESEAWRSCALPNAKWAIWVRSPTDE